MTKTISYSLLLAVGAMALTGCNKKMNQFAADYFSCNPNPLEVVGQNVPATVTGNVPPKFFLKNATVTVTPYLTFDGQEEASAPMTFQGENVRGNNPIVSYSNGGTVTIPVNYVYKPEMMKSELYLGFTVDQKGKQYVLPRVKVANGVIATAAWADAASATPAIANDKFQRNINETYEADIRFLINQANLRPAELNGEQVTTFGQSLIAANNDPKRVIEEINIDSYASPDGALDFNTQLAQNRETNTKDYLTKKLKKDNIKEFGELTSQFTAEDWEGFQKLVQNSNIQDKELILSVLSMYKDPEEREREIRNLSQVFDQLAQQILPQLRRSRLTAQVKVLGKTDQELNEALANNPSSLSADEMLFAATLTNDPKRQREIYQDVIKYYPNDYRGYNDMGRLEYEQGNYSAAASNFAQAQRLNPNAPEVAMNQGLLSLLNSDLQAANSQFGKAAGLEDLGPALGMLYLAQGQNAKAEQAFGNDISNNAALAQILNKNYSKARTTLGAINNPDATTYYLAAVLAARQNDAQGVAANLQKAKQLNPQMGQRAAQDLEFAGFTF